MIFQTYLAQASMLTPGLATQLKMEPNVFGCKIIISESVFGRCVSGVVLQAAHELGFNILFLLLIRLKACRSYASLRVGHEPELPILYVLCFCCVHIGTVEYFRHANVIVVVY